MAGGRPKGLPKTGGRQKGAMNKVTADIKAMIEGALQDAGGRAYLARQAEANPAAFMGLVGKILPKEITGANGGPIMFAISPDDADI